MVAAAGWPRQGAGYANQGRAVVVLGGRGQLRLDHHEQAWSRPHCLRRPSASWTLPGQRLIGGWPKSSYRHPSPAPHPAVPAARRHEPEVTACTRGQARPSSPRAAIVPPSKDHGQGARLRSRRVATTTRPRPRPRPRRTRSGSSARPGRSCCCGVPRSHSHPRRATRRSARGDRASTRCAPGPGPVLAGRDTGRSACQQRRGEERHTATLPPRQSRLRADQTAPFAPSHCAQRRGPPTAARRAPLHDPGSC